MVSNKVKVKYFGNECTRNFFKIGGKKNNKSSYFHVLLFFSSNGKLKNRDCAPNRTQSLLLINIGLTHYDNNLVYIFHLIERNDVAVDRFSVEGH